MNYVRKVASSNPLSHINSASLHFGVGYFLTFFVPTEGTMSLVQAFASITKTSSVTVTGDPCLTLKSNLDVNKQQLATTGAELRDWTSFSMLLSLFVLREKKFFLSAAQEKNISCFFRSNPSRCFDDLTDSCENNSLVRHRRA